MVELQLLREAVQRDDVSYWDGLDEEDHLRILDAVRYTIVNRMEGAQSRHNKWAKEKMKEGWTYGTVYSLNRKCDPNVCEWEKLPVVERHRMRLFVAVVNSLV
jgi:hypothetical protein